MRTLLTEFFPADREVLLDIHRIYGIKSCLIFARNLQESEHGLQIASEHYEEFLAKVREEYSQIGVSNPENNYAPLGLAGLPYLHKFASLYVDYLRGNE